MEVKESMIRSIQNIDVDCVLSIWLEASIKAHDFVGADFWQKQLNAMRDVYIPNSETYQISLDSIHSLKIHWRQFLSHRRIKGKELVKN